MSASKWRSDAALRLFYSNFPGEALAAAQQIAENCCEAFGHDDTSTDICFRCGARLAALAPPPEPAEPRGGKRRQGVQAVTLSGRLLAQLAEVFLRDASAAVDPCHSHDWLEDTAPAREITLADVEESRRLTLIAEHIQCEALMQGHSCDDPFATDEELEWYRVQNWERILG